MDCSVRAIEASADNRLSGLREFRAYPWGNGQKVIGLVV